MAATKRDVSGIFDADLTGKRISNTAGATQSLHLNHNGVTFISDRAFPEWTELAVQMRLPQNSPHKTSHITCRGVVVQCTKRPTGSAYEISLLFLDLPKRAHPRLDLRTSQSPPATVWISH